MMGLTKETDIHGIVYYRYNKRVIAALMGNKLHVSLAALDNAQTIPEDIDNVDYRRGVADMMALMVYYCFDDEVHEHDYTEGVLEVVGGEVRVYQRISRLLGDTV